MLRISKLNQSIHIYITLFPVFCPPQLINQMTPFQSKKKSLITTQGLWVAQQEAYTKAKVKGMLR